MTELGDALQRIHQLETALVTIQTWPIDQARLRREGWVGVVDVARAALGDTPTPDFYEDDEDPAKVRAAFDAGEKGVTTGTRNVTHDLRGDAAVIARCDDILLEPPQPETPGYVFGEPNAALRALLYPGETEET